MLRAFKGNNFIYEKLSADEQNKRGILGRLMGVIADTVNPTRNERLYSKSLWEKVFANPIMKEKIANRAVFGELCHPFDGREEVDPEKIAICLAELPQENDKGELVGIFDILNTPCGKILKTLCDYGTNIGISSRGSGETFLNSDGVEEVDPDSYDCVGWDAVFVPGVKNARLKYVTESLDSKSSPSLVESLNSLVENASTDDRKVMTETIDELNINCSTNNGDADDIDAKTENIVADDDGTDVVKDLQKVLKEKKELEATVAKLQEKLSVCYTKETERGDLAEKYQQSVKGLSEATKVNEALKKRLSLMTEKLKTQTAKLEEQTKTLNAVEKQLTESKEIVSQRQRTLTENAQKNESMIKTLRASVRTLREQASSTKAESDRQIKQLQEDIERTKTDLANERSAHSRKLTKANELTEKYKTVAKYAIGKYIDSQAIRLGVKSDEIKNRLPDGYSFDDIDRVCESLQSYQVSMSKLPFNLVKEKGARVSIKESKDSMLPANRTDDDVDEALKILAGLQ